MHKPLACLLIPLWLTACAQTATRTPDIDDEALAAEEEIQKQQRAAQVVEGRRFTTLRREKVFERMDRIAPHIQREGEKICQQLQQPDAMCRFRFRVIDKRELNAYADGEKIYVTPLMVSFAQTDEELAMVLAHEYAHNIFNHSGGAGMNAALGGVIGAVLDAAATSQGYGTAGDFTELGEEIGAISYSIPFEKEADYVGLYILANAGYNTEKAADLWRKFDLLDGEDRRYISVTHPTDAERTVAMHKTIKEIYDKRRAGKPLLPEVR